MKRFILISLFSLLMFALSACSLLPEPVYESGDIILVDDFSRPNFQWDVWKRDDDSTVAYYEDGLVFVINAPDTDYTSTLDRTYQDVHIEVLAENLNGLPNNGFGIVCRYQDDANYYAFLISSDGYYGIIRVLYGGYAVLNGGELQYTEIIKPGLSTNHIQAECEGNELSLRVNNVTLAAVQDDVFSDGLIGLTASTFEIPGTAIRFDNFLVTQP